MEYAEFCGNCYGTPAKEVEKKLEEGRHVILEIEVQGAMQIKQKCPDAVFVFVAPPSMDILRQRIIGRGTEPMDVIERRMEIAEQELRQIIHYDYVIVNDEVEKAVERLEKIKEAEQYRVSRNDNFIQEVCKL